MSKGIEPRYRHCPEVKRNVRVDEPQGECREAHGCRQEECPLDSEFRGTPQPPLVDTLRKLFQL